MVRPSVAAIFAMSLLLSACQSIHSITGDGAANQSGPVDETGDQKQIDGAMQRAYTAPVGQPVTWSNPDNGHTGTIITFQDGYSPQGAYCRQFQLTVTADSAQKKTTSKACQQPDGSWRIVQQ